MRRCLECECDGYTAAREYLGPITQDSEGRIHPPGQVATGRCAGCSHYKNDHEPGWLGRPLIRTGRGGRVLFSRWLLLGPLALIIGTSGGTITVNGKAESSGLTVLIEVAVALAFWPPHPH